MFTRPNRDLISVQSSAEKKIAAGWLARWLDPARGSGKLFFPIIYRSLNFHRVDALCQACHSHHGIAFARRALELLKIRLEVSPSEVPLIPQTGAYAVVANHPHGFIDGLLLMDLIGRYRKEFHLTVNYLLDDLEPLRDHFICVNSFSDHKVPRFATPAIRRIVASFAAGNPVCFFPAADVSCFQFPELCVTDPLWSPACLRLIRRANVPIIPVFIDGRNSILFQIARAVHPAFGLARLATELFLKTSQSVRIRVGKPIPPEAIGRDAQAAAALVRSAVYNLDPKRAAL